jgi:hypothetical protein
LLIQLGKILIDALVKRLVLEALVLSELSEQYRCEILQQLVFELRIQLSDVLRLVLLDGLDLLGHLKHARDRGV